MPQNGTILIADDDPNDAFFMEAALREVGLEQPVCVVEDGQAAIEYLAGEGRYADRKAYPFPVLLLLDLRMPRQDGFEVLRWLRQQGPPSGKLIVVALSATRLGREVELVQELGADFFLEKPLSYARFREEMRGILPKDWLRAS